MKRIAILLLSALPCFAAEGKPPCNAGNRGMVWPPAGTALFAGRCEAIEMCSLGTWKYAWQPLTVHVSRLGKHRAGETAGCVRAAGAADSERQAGEHIGRP